MNKILNRDLSTRLASQAGQQVILRQRLLIIALHKTGEDTKRRAHDERKNRR